MTGRFMIAALLLTAACSAPSPAPVADDSYVRLAAVLRDGVWSTDGADAFSQRLAPFAVSRQYADVLERAALSGSDAADSAADGVAVVVTANGYDVPAVVMANTSPSSAVRA